MQRLTVTIAFTILRSEIFFDEDFFLMAMQHKIRIAEKLSDIPYKKGVMLA